jgi:hypothetical protein
LSESAAAASDVVVPTTTRSVVTYADLFRHNPRFNWFLLSYVVTNLGEYVWYTLLFCWFMFSCAAALLRRRLPNLPDRFHVN